jgi:predicted SAM-dependent methyltransferase
MINDYKSFIFDNFKGLGLEIGAQHTPFKYNNKTSMIYQDRLPLSQLKQDVQAHNKDINIEDIIDADIIMDAETVPFRDNYFDFVCNSHVLEHLKNPIQAIREWIRVIKPNGHLFLIVPDKRYTFDKERKLTSTYHLVKDYVNCQKDKTLEHYTDFYNNVHKITDKKIIQKAFDEQEDIHLHTFTYKSFLDFIESIKTNFELTESKLDGINICVLIRKK